MSLGQAFANQACCSCRCQSSQALDPDIKGLRKKNLNLNFGAWTQGCDLYNQLTSIVKE